MLIREEGELIHDDISQRGLLGSDIALGNALVDMYSKCGALIKAQEVLDELPDRDVVSWSAMIDGYAQQGEGHKALACFEKMKDDGVTPDEVAFISTLKACGSIGEIDKGEQIHDDLARKGLLGCNVALDNTLIDMYVKCGALGRAQEVLKQLPARDAVSWNALIAGYAEQCKGEEALACFDLMQQEGISPDRVTFTCILKACASIGAIDKGKYFHDEIRRQGLLKHDIVLGNALVDMYARCGALSKSAEVLDELPHQNVISWSALIDGYVQKGRGQDALHCLERMQAKGLSPDAVTYISVLKACGVIGALDKGEQIHDEISRQGLLENSLVLGNALIDMYVKCGALVKAQAVLQGLTVHDVISWNTLIAGYAQQGQGEEAFKCLRAMQQKGISPVEVTYTCILKACSTLGAADKGEAIHDEILRQGLLKNNVVLGNALVDMYAKCGALEKAQQVLDELPIRDLISWNALITGYAQRGQFHNVLRCFRVMEHKGIFPDAITFSCVLNACSHSGLIEEGEIYFSNITSKYGIIPNSEHYTCMVDLFGRAGHLDKAVAVIQRMPSTDYPSVWSALLGSCRKWGDVDLGRWAFDHAIQVDGNDSAAYVCMANIYAAAGRQDDAENIELMRAESSRKFSGSCSVPKGSTC
ncbi:hypothetical protein KP509_05G026100 [Ceratopteris richardii]|uniref:Pentatricopeptide repeat-containing protein n=1 Tax=Ceratopteris richardii TaxID=49495 RepID=A0A8T2USJ7_CERRI|nr:hypothetical protein KP509_05G026100 [Ceratopteris richardii]